MPKHVEIKFNAPENINGTALRVLMDSITFELMRHWYEDSAEGHVFEGATPIGKWRLLETDPVSARDPARRPPPGTTIRGAIRQAVEAMGPPDGPKLPLPIDLRLPKPTPKWGTPDIKAQGAQSGRLSCKKPNTGNHYGS